MTSTSSDVVSHGDLPDTEMVRMGIGADLRAGAWTRHGSRGVLGDAVTEQVLGGLAERAREVARAQGYATGWAEGRRVALAQAAEHAEEVRRTAAADRERRDAELASAVSALDEAIGQLHRRAAEAVEAVAARTVPVALELAEAVLGREVATATDPGGDAVRRALAVVEAGPALVVRLHPEDAGRLDTGILQGRSATVVPDPAVARGGAVVETEDSFVDATLESAMARVREVLAP